MDDTASFRRLQKLKVERNVLDFEKAAHQTQTRQREEALRHSLKTAFCLAAGTAGAIIVLGLLKISL
ncbi:MAG TPA: hypothetical protein PKX87_08270 [Alphaproteobacteria bacterium]|nr:hypothetical protein [Alphaproteobacteria bacterium]